MSDAWAVPLSRWPEVTAAVDAVPAGDIVAFEDGPVDGPDAWAFASGLLQARPERTAVVVLEAGRRAPGILALMAATLWHLSDGRLRAVVLEGAAAGALAAVVTRLLRGETITDPPFEGALLGLLAPELPIVAGRDGWRIRSWPRPEVH